MNILILGNGFIGQNIYQHLLQSSSNDNIVDILSKSKLDYTNREVLTTYLLKHKYNFIINASGYTGVPNIDAAESNKELCWHLNVEVPVTIVAASRNSNATVIHISSGCVFDKYTKQWTEDDIPNFGMFNSYSSFYSKTKHAAETLIKDDAIILRIRMPFCGVPSSRNYLTKLLQYDQLISMPNSVTCVEDFCNTIDRVLEHSNLRGIYHLFNEGTLTAKDVITCFAKYGLTNPNHRFIPISELNTIASRSNTILSTKHTSKIFGAFPNAIESLEKCVQKYITLT